MDQPLSDKVEHSDEKLSVEHQPDKNRFAAEVEGKTAVLEYQKVGNTLIFTHTEVPEGLEGRGLGAALAKTGLDYVRDHDMTAAPLCPFVKAYIRRHPEYQSLVRMGG